MSSLNKTILLLGGSPQQVPAIKQAQNMGLRTVLIDYLPDNPGQYVADKWYQESTTDVEAVYNIAKKENVNGILAYASDPAALPAAIVCERLGLPTNPSKSIEILGIKHKFRTFLKNNGFPCPNIFTFQSDCSFKYIIDGLKTLTFPIVIKPTDSSGSKGVTFLNSLDNIDYAINHAKAYSRNGIIIAEEFIKRGFPNVIGGDIFVENGEIVLFGEMACLRDNNGNGLIPIGKQYPSGLIATQESALRNELRRLIKKLKIHSGEFNIELIIDQKGNPNFLELGPRAGGNMIPIQLSDIFDIDLINANILAAINENISLKPIIPKAFYMTHVLHSHIDGCLCDINFSEEIEPYIYRKVIYKKKGEKIEAFDGAGKAIGIIFMKFPSKDEMINIQHNIDQHINIKI